MFVIRIWPDPLKRVVDVQEKGPRCPGEEGRPRPQRPRWRPGAQQGLGRCYRWRTLGRKPHPSSLAPNSLIARRSLPWGPRNYVTEFLLTRTPSSQPLLPGGLVALCLPSRGQRDRTISWTFPPRKFSSRTFNSIQRPKIKRSRQECSIPAPPRCGVRIGPSPTSAPSKISGSPPGPPPLREPALSPSLSP